MASGIRRVRGRNGLRARDAAHGHTAVVAVIFVWTVFIAVVHVRVDLVVLVGAARLRLLLRLLQLFDLLSQFCSALRSLLCLAFERDARRHGDAIGRNTKGRRKRLTQRKGKRK